VEAPPSMPQRFSSFLSDSVSFAKKPPCIGVDLGHEDLKLIKVSRASEKKIELLGCARVPFAADIPREHPKFPQFLRSALLNFCGQGRHFEIWTTISSARVETRHIRIPKVSSKQLPNSVFWAYQRLSAFNDKETIFDFDVLGEVEDGGVRKYAVMAYTAPRKEVEELKDLFQRAGFPLTGISIVPFSVQTLLRAGRIRTSGAAVASLYIGRDWSRIDVFADDGLVLSRGIKAGIRTMAEALQKEIEQNLFEISLTKSPTSDPNRIRAIKTRLRKEVEAAQSLFFGAVHREGEGPSDIEASHAALKEEKIFQLILPALERLVRQIERTIRHFALHFDNARVERLFVSSGVRPHPRLLEYIGEELGLPAEILNPFRPDADLEARVEIPETTPEQNAFAPAMGMALSSNSITPNFLFTYKDKGKIASTKRLNRGVIAGFTAVILACLGASYWQEQQIKTKDQQRSALQRQLEGFEVRINRNLIIKLVEQIRSKNQSMEGVGSHYMGVALMGEVAQITPPNVRLLSLRTRLSGGKAPAGAKPDGLRKIVMEGVIFGDRVNLESELAGYLMVLKNSPMFRQPTISKKTFDLVDDRQAIRFTAQMDLV
jgi:type IV pilus assembly protein PilM